MKLVQRTDEEIQEIRRWAKENIREGRSNFPFSSYEEGLEAGLAWVLGESEYRPDQTGE